MSGSTVVRQTELDSGVPDGSRHRFPLLQATFLAVFVYFYTLLGGAGDLPPIATVVQGSVLVLLASWWIWKMIRREGIASSPVALPLVAFLGSVTLSTLFSTDPRLSQWGLVSTAAGVLIFFLLCDLLVRGWRAEMLIDAVLLFGAITILNGLEVTASWYLEWWRVRVPDYPPFLVPYRLFGVAGHPNLLAPLINLGVPFAFVRLAYAERRAPAVAHAFWLLAATIVLFFTRSRGGLVGAAVAVTLTFVGLLLAAGPPRPGDVGARLRQIRLPLAVLAACLALFVALQVGTAALSPSAYDMQSGGSVSSIGGRPTFWAIAWRDFLAHPLVGNGPRTYALSYVSTMTAVRHFTANHAHSLYLTVLGEQGVFGILALAWLLLSGLAVALRTWRSLLRAEMSTGKLLVIGASASLAGMLVHSLVEVPTALPANGILVMLIGAATLSATGALQRGPSIRSRWLAPALVLPLLLIVLLPRQHAAYGALFAGVRSAMGGDWEVAAETLDEAVTLDPAFVFYHAQRGYAYGVLADSSDSAMGPNATEALRRGVESYQVALNAGPAHVPDLLNTAWLLERSGEDEPAERLLARAVERGADWALPALLLAERYVSQGRHVEAEALFEAAFKAEARGKQMAACRVSATCRAAAERAAEPDSPVIRVVTTSRKLLAEGRAEAALEALSQVPITSADPLPWLGRADAHLALGELAQARYALKVAYELRVQDAARVARIHAALELASGQTGRAIAVLERSTRLPVDGFPIIVWARPGLPGPLLPSLDLLQRTADDLTLYRELARLYTLEGRESDAAWANDRAEALDALLR